MSKDFQYVMTDGLCGCMEDVGSCLMSCFFPHCTHGCTMGDIGSSCFCSCLFCLCCACCDVNKIEEKLLGHSSGCCKNMICLYFCGCCVISRNRRAVDLWLKAGKPNVANTVSM